jgi:hypothetical protein
MPRLLLFSGSLVYMIDAAVCEIDDLAPGDNQPVAILSERHLIRYSVRGCAQFFGIASVHGEAGEILTISLYGLPL